MVRGRCWVHHAKGLRHGRRNPLTDTSVFTGLTPLFSR
ncbi:hypothetical protein TC41_1842 [Alicyclobacillus acidocaldarius subsp. acidocaldarius Tc-4-1]|uniref:Uncharacterized protein n=1 Tax=Alicyclobacillus acidocaldarius (strain Tc-4-1) TaxID=1048834 RepID=F8ICU5_ALIAT|nr:hypothetical protein TC41_1817 [Alicyclobacillus acidocaldarius subsp. acidocaldarius Tc-4-1]AEJ43759.1 hypothetical protein TC41_1842 [Alicyclobacillus acidocaldarius subsp. acidocaldarius Tc-4-1]